MAVNILIHPDEVIVNEPSFQVTNTLSEDPTHQNLRTRALVYIGGETTIVATLEQTKGLNDWDFFDLLKDFTGKCNEAVGGSDPWVQPAISAELLTGWTEQDSNFTTFTVSGREITSAITGATHDYAKSNDLGAVVAGDIIVVALENDWADTGATSVDIVFSDASGADGIANRTVYAGRVGNDLIANHIFFFRVSNTITDPTVYIGSDTGNTNFTGTVSIHKITDLKNSPGIYFRINFQEVYEDGSDVTTVGANAWADSMLFVPAIVRPGETFDDFLIDGATKEMLTRASGNTSLYRFGIGMEMRFFYVSVSAYVRANHQVDAGSVNSADTPNMGWGMFIISDDSTAMDAEDTAFLIAIRSVENGAGVIYSSADVNVNCEVNCFPDIRALNFVGDLGEENILFRGLPSETGTMDKSFIRNVNRVRRALKAYRSVQMVLRTLFETEEMRRLLHELAYTEKPVWMFDSDFTDNFREVAVLNEEIPIVDRKELIENEITIEYHE